MAEIEELREKIVVGADELFVRYGMRSVTMDDISSHLGMSKKTIYTAFEDKDEIVLAVTTRRLQEMSGECEAIIHSATDEVAGLVELSLCLKRNFKDMNPVLLFDLFKYHRKAWDVWIRYKNEVIRELIADQIRSGITNGYFRNDIDPDIISVYRVEQVQMAFDPQIFPHSRFNLIDVQMQLFDHFVLGLLTDEGRRLYYCYKEKIREQTL